MPDFLKDISPTVMGVVLAVVISVLRVIYDKEETKPLRIMLEALLCGSLAVVAGSAINAMGMSQDWTLFAGGVVGFIGSQTIRNFAIIHIKNRVENNTVFNRNSKK